MAEKKQAIQKLSNGAELVVDAESGESIEVTPIMRRTEEMIRSMVHMKVFETAALVGFIQREKLYLAVGCTNFNEYIRDHLPFSRTQVHIFQTISRNLSNFLPEISVIGDDVYAGEHPDGASGLEGLGTKKLYALAQLKSEDIAELVSGRNIVDQDGNTVSLDDIRDMTTRAVTVELKKVKAKYSGDTAILSEKLKKAQSEKKALEAELADKDELISRANELERMYGAGATKVEDKYNLIADAKKYLSMAQQTAVKSALVNTDPAGVQREMAGVIRTMDEYRQRLVEKFGFVVEVVE